MTAVQDVAQTSVDLLVAVSTRQVLVLCHTLLHLLCRQDVGSCSDCEACEAIIRWLLNSGYECITEWGIFERLVAVSMHCGPVHFVLPLFSYFMEYGRRGLLAGSDLVFLFIFVCEHQFVAFILRYSYLEPLGRSEASGCY